MNSVTFSTAKPLGFYSQSLQDKLYPILSNGEKLTLEDIWRITSACANAFQRYSSYVEYNQVIDFWDAITESGQEDEFWAVTPDGHCGYKKGELLIDGFKHDGKQHFLTIEEWLALNRWSSELAEIRLRDLKRFQRDFMSPPITAVPPDDWDVKSA